MSRSSLSASVLVLCFATAGTSTAAEPQAPWASSSVTNIVIAETRSPTFQGTGFGAVGPYEHLFGYVEGELDPAHPRNRRIANLDRAPRNARGNVEYWADIQILKPVDQSRGNGALILDVPNRGNKRLTGRYVNGRPSTNDPALAEHAGSGWLMRQGYTLVWVGWEGLVQSGDSRLAADFPIATELDGSPVTARTSQEFRFGNLDRVSTGTRYYPQHETHLAPGDQFPFTYEVLHDPISGRNDGIFAHWRVDSSCPRTFHVDSDTEIFQARASLVVTTTTGAPLPLPGNVRAYFLAGSQHGPPSTSSVPRNARFSSNPLPYDMYSRALIAALDAWATDGTSPPDSRYPSIGDGTLAPPDAPGAKFPNIPGHSYSGLANPLRLLDHLQQPPEEGPAYPVFVATKDADGNNTAGVRHPFVQVPDATYTGWNLCRDGLTSGDERPSLEERYPSRSAYVEAMSRAAEAQVRERLLFRGDADRIVEEARRAPWLTTR